jgi:hypothetical protein
VLLASIAGYERHPHRRIHGPLALSRVPHHGHGQHAGRRRPSSSDSTPKASTRRSARPARRLPACGNSCATPRTPSNCTRPRPRPTACGRWLARAGFTGAKQI